jgi:hypothetical protein
LRVAGPNFSSELQKTIRTPFEGMVMDAKPSLMAPDMRSISYFE